MVATRATCDRLHCGCVLVKDKRIISTGYNGSLPGVGHCDDVGHLMMNDHCVATEHAERNAVANAARAGVSTLGATAYITHNPCWDCLKHLVSAGITKVVFDEVYGDITKTYPENINEILDKICVYVVHPVNDLHVYYKGCTEGQKGLIILPDLINYTKKCTTTK